MMRIPSPNPMANVRQAPAKGNPGQETRADMSGAMSNPGAPNLGAKSSIGPGDTSLSAAVKCLKKQ